MEEKPSRKPIDRLHATEQWGAAPTDEQLLRLQKTYRSLIEGDRLQWTSYLRLERVLGRGGQGVVFLTRRRGSDDFTLPVAVKFFTPQGYPSMEAYEGAMHGVASIAAKVAGIQHDNLIDVQDFIERSRIRIMVSEWIDGFDLERLLEPATLEHCRQTVTPERWSYINDVIATAGVDSSRLKAGVAVAVVRDCLNGLAALHRERIVHGDIKPANLMLKRTGLAKLIDLGSAVDLRDPPTKHHCTPAYAAPEVLMGNRPTPRSDLASLGYVLVELLSGRKLFPQPSSAAELLEQKKQLPQQLHQLLPPEVERNGLLVSLCQRLIAFEPGQRFASAEAADLADSGAAAFHRQLVLSNLASEYDQEIRFWLEDLNLPV